MQVQPFRISSMSIRSNTVRLNMVRCLHDLVHNLGYHSWRLAADSVNPHVAGLEAEIKVVLLFSFP
jgi:hypothetical protein